MSSYLKPINNKSVVDIIVSRIINAVINGELKVGDKLPTESELCESFDVGRNSIREAVKILITYGILEIRRADGTYVTSHETDRMIEPMVYWLILENDSSQNIIELRKCIEIGTIDILIKNIRPEYMEKLRQSVEEMQRYIDSIAETGPADLAEHFSRMDIDFHQLLFGATENPLIIKIAKLILKITEPSLLRTARWAYENNALGQIHARHKRLVDLIVKKDDANVGKALEDSYSIWEHVLGTKS
jgi:DNA-binding FadR family transcriptional regulator